MSGWNGSDRKGAAPVQPNVVAKKPSPVRGLIAGLVVVAAACVAYFAFFSGSEKPQNVKAEKERGRIKEVKPAAAPTNRVEKVKKPRPFWENPNTNGLTRDELRKWHFMNQPPAKWTNRVNRLRAKPSFAIFPTHAENQIACIMTLEPGQGLVGSPQYGKRFAEEFMKSCETPIIIEEKDTEEQKALKKAMIQTKIELRQRMADGEDICKIMEDAHNEAMRLGTLRQDVERQMRDLIKETAKTSEDIDDCISSANKLLEKEGIAPITINPITRRSMMRRLGIADPEENK